MANRIETSRHDFDHQEYLELLAAAIIGSENSADQELFKKAFVTGASGGEKFVFTVDINDRVAALIQDLGKVIGHHTAVMGLNQVDVLDAAMEVEVPHV